MPPAISDKDSFERMSKEKKFQNRKASPKDPVDGHTHDAVYDENGNGGTSVAGTPEHSHVVYDFRVQPFYYYDSETREDYISTHPGSLAFADDGCEWITVNGAHICVSGDDGGDDEPEIRKRAKDILSKATLKDPISGNLPDKDRLDALGKDARRQAKRDIKRDRERSNMNEELGECEMEIFREGTHNGEDFSAEDLDEIAANFKKLKNEVRPKLKITHLGDEPQQETLAGLMSYGDIEEVYVRRDSEGRSRLYARVTHIPKGVIAWIAERRFPERSIEIYPEFKLGTKEGPVYRNVLKAVALLGHQMPAVTGMAPIKLEECLECQGTSCFRENFKGEEPELLSMSMRILEERISNS